MKIKLSKSQWEKIGQKAGWYKKAQEDLRYVVWDIYDLRVGHDDMGVTIKVDDDRTKQLDSIFDVEVSLEWEYEPAQHGGWSDPSWDAAYWLSAWNVKTISPAQENTQTIPITPELISQIKIDLEKYIEENEDEINSKHYDYLAHDY